MVDDPGIFEIAAPFFGRTSQSSVKKVICESISFRKHNLSPNGDNSNIWKSWRAQNAEIFLSSFTRPGNGSTVASVTNTSQL